MVYWCTIVCIWYCNIYDKCLSSNTHSRTDSIRKTRAGIWIGAGTNTQGGGTPGTVTINGNLLADASVASGGTFVKSDATIRIYGSTINPNGSQDPKAKAKGGNIEHRQCYC